jgi:hypothetical protein
VSENTDLVSYWERNWVANETNAMIKVDYQKLVKQSIRLKLKGIGMQNNKGNTYNTILKQ